jgi:hypothetical protein
MRNLVLTLIVCWAIVILTLVPSAGGVQAKNPPLPRLTSTRDLEKYVGTYPCSNGILKDPVLLNALKSILGRDYRAYREHMQFSGCGAIERRDDFLLMDVSQLHVGGYSSLIFVRINDGKLFLFWLKSTVSEKQWQFYGQKPLPETVKRNVEIEMNSEWGHVAQFKMRGEILDIELR